MSTDGVEVHPEDALQVAQRALERINDLEAENDDLREEVRHLEERIATLEGDEVAGGHDTGADEFDARDRSVVEHLEPGETVSVTKLRGLYRRHTDVRSERTLKERMKGLVARPEFYFSDIGEITYDPDGGESA